MMGIGNEETLLPSKWVLQPSRRSLGFRGQGCACPQQGLPEPAAGFDKSCTTSTHALLCAAWALPHQQPCIWRKQLQSLSQPREYLSHLAVLFWLLNGLQQFVKHPPLAPR